MQEMNLPSKNIFVVLGIARSGTSVIAKALNSLGVDLGEKLNPANKWNPKGFWEDLDIVYDVNQKILDKLNCPLGVFRELHPEELNHFSMQDLKEHAATLLISRLQNCKNWGFKDPNTVRVLPLWQSIFKKLNLNENYVITLRNPLESANSYQSKTFKFNQEKTLMMWLLHLVPAINYTQGKKRVIVDYDRILKDPINQLTRIKNKLDLNEIANDEKGISNFADDFLDADLRHSQLSLSDLESHPASNLVPLCLKAYKILLKLAADEIEDDNNFRVAWDDITNEFYRMYPLYSYLDTILLRNRALEKSIAKIHRSWSWKLFFPVRLFKGAFHRYKKILSS